MNNIISLDCTLRDGGYCNRWEFGEQNIRKIIRDLTASGIEIIECGFLTNKCEYNHNVTKYENLRQLENFIPSDEKNARYVLMVNYGEYNPQCIPDKQDSVIDGIRVAFHKKNCEEALEFCRKIKKKGYLVFLQPMVSMSYTDKEFIKLIQSANEILPYAFYIVDSFGMMNKKVLAHYFEMAETYLKQEILIGFHSHNNLQSAFANAQSLIERKTERDIIVDCSVYGMGRGAGNLNSELFLNELNRERGKKYHIKPLLQIMDDVLNRFYEEKPWGYSLPNYLSAVYMIHPNYAGYLTEKKTLKVEDIDGIFSMMEVSKGVEYSEKYISDLYFQYMSGGIVKSEHLEDIRQKTRKRKILLIAPGKRAISEQVKIQEFIEENKPVIISINHEHPTIESDYIFVSNIRRYDQLDRGKYNKMISTSNIKSTDSYISVDYFALLNEVEPVRDNAGLMAIKFAIDKLQAKQIYVAGMDGYSHDLNNNYESKEMNLLASETFMDAMNYGMEIALMKFEKEAEIHFITESLLDKKVRSTE